MGKKMGKLANLDVFGPIKAEKERQRKERENRRKAIAAQGSLSDRFTTGLKNWGLRLFHTFFMLMCMYLLVLCGTLLIPSTMAYILGGLGYTLENTVEIFLSAFSGLFLTGWMLAITLFLGKKVIKLYMHNMKKTMSEEARNRLDTLK